VLPGVRFIEDSTDQSESASGRTYPRLEISSLVRRKTGYWALNILLPMFFITCISFTFLSIPAQDISGRSSVVLTTLLTTVAFKFIIADKLPNISYLSLIDFYLLFCIIGQAIMVMIIVINGVLMKDSDGHDFGNRPGLNCAVAVLSWILLHVIWYLLLLFVGFEYAKKFQSPNRVLYVETFKGSKEAGDKITGENILQDFETVQKYLRSVYKEEKSRHYKLGKDVSIKRWTYAEAKESCKNSAFIFESSNQRNFDVIAFGSEEDAHVWQATMSEYFARIRERKDPIETQHRSLWKLIKYSVSADLLKTKLPVLISFDEDFDNNVFPVIEPLKTEWYCLQMDPTRARS
jgi:hypothetical protein